MATLGAVAATSVEDVRPQRFSVTYDYPVRFVRDLLDVVLLDAGADEALVPEAVAWLRRREAGA